MQDGGHNSVHVAPLRIKKSQKDFRANLEQVSTVDTKPQYDKELPEEPYSPRPRFQNFLRASYPFQPQDQFSSTSVTVALATGDIVLVHSIHTNGWADGTLLGTGARGWLPTNYCEPYDYATMRPLLKALTEFWDIIRSDGSTTTELYRSHDYMRGMVAGVRFLLEKSSCLTREATLIKQHNSLRKARKAVLSDLSLLVKASKNVHNLGLESDSPDFDKVIDEILLKAFQVVTRAVSFFDTWSEETQFMQSPTLTRFPSPSPEPLSPSDSSTAHGSVVQLSGKRKSFYATQNASASSASVPTVPHYSRPRPASISRPPAVTHRMSYTGRNTQSYRGNLASEQLSDTYDAFLGVLASFLGSHMQSRSSSELLLTTQQAVKSCRKLLEIVEIVLEHDVSSTDDLQQAKDIMYDKITELVNAAREVFRPIQSDDDDLIYLPGEGARLVNAATACVSGAGRCVAKAKVLLEDIGDFELELRGDPSESTSPFDTASLSPSKPSYDQLSTAPVSRSSSHRSIPAVEVSPGFETPIPPPETKTVEPMPLMEGFWIPVADPTESPSSADFDLQNEQNQNEKNAHIQHQRSLARTALHGSESTLVSSVRDSGPSFISQTSTRATSPDSHLKASPKPTEEEREDVEDALMEHQFAHELVISPEGRVIGGTLNAVIERLTSHESTPDPTFVSMVYLTFRLFATPQQFAEALVYRFDYIEQCPRISQPVRFRVANIFKGWLESHWRDDCDGSTISYIMSFVEEKIVPLSSSAANRLLDLINVICATHGPAVPRVLSSIGKTNTAGTSSRDSDQPPPAPLLSRSQLNSLKTWKMSGSGLCVTDFDPLELARQLTIKTSSVFCSILPEELLPCEFMKQSNSLAVNLRALSQLSTDIGNLVVDSILLLEDTKRRAAVIKQWIKVASKCLELQNYETLMTINASLNVTSILRLKKTWDLIGQKSMSIHEQHSEICSHAKNYAGLRQRFESATLPCVPFVGIYRTDLTFTDQGNPATRELKTGDGTVSVINIAKHTRTAEIISDLQRFQISYRLTSVDELQTWLQDECVRVRAAGDKNIQNQYRRSLILEPKLDVNGPQQLTKMKAFASMTSLTNKDRFDFLSRTYNHRDKHNSMGTL